MRLLRPLFAAAKAQNAMTNFVFRTGGYNKLGLKTDDLLYDSLPEVKEAIRRLPEDVRLERVYRMKRALHLSGTHALLPPEEWTKPEDDDRYLLPYLHEVLAEIEEKKNWVQE